MKHYIQNIFMFQSIWESVLINLHHGDITNHHLEIPIRVHLMFVKWLWYQISQIHQSSLPCVVTVCLYFPLSVWTEKSPNGIHGVTGVRERCVCSVAHFALFFKLLLIPAQGMFYSSQWEGSVSLSNDKHWVPVPMCYCSFRKNVSRPNEESFPCYYRRWLGCN